MKFKIIVKRWTIFYFFIQNLSEWHFSCVKAYNETWRKELGKFTSQEEKTLAKFKIVHQKYTFGKDYLGQYFYLTSKPFDILKQKLPKQDSNIVSQTFSIFKNKFNVFYKKEYPLLKKWKLLLDKNLNYEARNKRITNILEVIYNNYDREKNLDVYVLPSIRNVTSGSGYIGNNKGITAAISRQPLKNNNHSIAIVWHETIHRCFEKKYFMPLLESAFSSDRDTINLIKEVTASSLFPNGLLGEKFFQKCGDLLNINIPPKYNEQILKIIEPYIENKKSFDVNYIKKIYNVVRELKGTVK